MAQPTPYKIAVSDEQLDWINERVRTTRLPPGRKNISTEDIWSSWGLPVDYAQRLKDYWTNEYDWRSIEKRLNEELNQFTIPLQHKDEDISLHFLHHRSERKDAIPLVIVHGWPGSPLEISPIIRHLTSPSSPDEQAYHVIVPSLPGFAFSSYPSNPCSPMDMGDLICSLMTALGYPRFMAQAGDWGSMIVRLMATKFPEHCVAVHLNFVVNGPPNPLYQPLATAKLLVAWLTSGWNLTAFENGIMGRMKWWLIWENGYNAIQGTKPLTLSYGLTDSPFGMMCWLREKLQYIVDDGFEWTDEQTITWAMPYIINGTPGHAEIYKWTPRGEQQDLAKWMKPPIPAQVSFGASLFPKDVMGIPRWWAEGSLAKNIIFWREHEKGGHFPCFESPAVLAADIRTFTKAINDETVKALKSTE